MADATTMKPKLIPDDALLPRDNSGGLDYEPYTMVWDDGGRITGGPKPHLSPSGEASEKTGNRESKGGREKRGYAVGDGNAKN